MKEVVTHIRIMTLISTCGKVTLRFFLTPKKGLFPLIGSGDRRRSKVKKENENENRLDNNNKL